MPNQNQLTSFDENIQEDAVLRANKDYHDQIAEEYDTDPSTSIIYRENVQGCIEYNIEFLARATRGEVFLDFGTGTGNLAKFAKDIFTKTLGLDISMGMLQIAKEKHSVDVCLFEGDKLPIFSNTVDAIGCYSVLHHLYQQEPYFREFARVLKPGGYFYADFDPNACFLLRRGSVRKLLRAVWNAYNAVYTRSIHVTKRDEDFQITQDLAEYHQNYTDGLIPEKIASNLLQAGFRDVKIHYHFSVLNMQKISKDPLRMHRYIFPFMAVVAIK